jgi:folate-binding protein YgfZ
MLTDLEVYRRPAFWLLGLEAERAAPIADRLDQSIFSEDVRVADVTTQLAEIVVVGGDAASRVATASSVPIERLDRLVELAHVEWQEGFIARLGDSKLPMFIIVVPIERRREVTDRLEATGVRPVSQALLEALRIEAGRPRFGVDTTEDSIPLEAGLLERAISTTKGCYVGQEIVIRVLHRGGGRVAKRLVTLSLAEPADGPPPRGTPLLDGITGVGQLTSVSPSPTSSGVIALGYVQRNWAEEGRRLTVGETGVQATVTGFAR